MTPSISSAWSDVNLYYLAVSKLLVTELACVMSHFSDENVIVVTFPTPYVTKH